MGFLNSNLDDIFSNKKSKNKTNEISSNLDKSISYIENSLLNVGHNIASYRDIDRKSVDREFSQLMQYSEQLLHDLNIGNYETKNRILSNINNVVTYFKANINLEFEKQRARESEAYYNKGAKLREISDEELKQVPDEKLVEEFNTRIVTTLENTVKMNEDDNQNERKKTKKLIDDRIRNELNQELRGIFRNNTFETIDDFLGELQIYLRNTMAPKILDEFDNNSKVIDTEIDKLVDDSISKAKLIISKGIAKENKNEVDDDKKAEVRKKNLDVDGIFDVQDEMSKKDDFIASLNKNMPSEEEIIKKMADDDKKAVKNPKKDPNHII